jgi:acetyltransferase-like isoleucine patch superfamily enzyme
MMNEVKRRSWAGKAMIRFLRWIASSFPSNSVRVAAIRGMGFSVGKDVYVGPGLILSTMNSDNSCHLLIGDRVSIGPGVCLILASDPNNSKLAHVFTPVRGNIRLEADCWLGARCILLPNVSIGEAAVIAAGAVVTESVDAYTVVGGVPAKTLRKIDSSLL